jgi:hypothetical protein
MENKRVEITTLAHHFWNLHEHDEQEVIVYVPVAGWELEALYCILGQKFAFISHLST